MAYYVLERLLDCDFIKKVLTFMDYLIVTNNAHLLPFLKSHNTHVERRFFEGTIKDIVFLARDLLLSGYSLVADPLAGRLERTSPYLSIFLKKSHNNAKTPDEIIRIEYFIGAYFKNVAFLESLDEDFKQDFAIIDASLIQGCYKQVFTGR